MKIISWNVNGIRSAHKNGLLAFLHNQKADICLFQEVKISAKDLKTIPHPDKYQMIEFLPAKNGYAGLLAYTRVAPIRIIFGLGKEIFDNEARVLTLEFEGFILINVYFPHTRRNLERMDYKLVFNQTFESYVESVAKRKPVIIGGDFNVAHTEMDLANPRSNMKNAGFTPEERQWFDTFLKRNKLIDSFRLFHQGGGHFTWWSNFYNARARNIGWRIDYFLISKVLRPRIKKSDILANVYGSDHAPIVLELK